MRASARVALLLVMFSLLLFVSGVSTAVADELNVFAYRDDIPEEAKPGEWTVRIQFNKPVFATNLVQALSTHMENSTISTELFTVQDQKTGKEALSEFRLKSKDPSKVISPVVIRIKKGLSDSSGRFKLAKDFSYTFIPSQSVSIFEVEPYYNSKSDKGISVSLSSGIEKKDLEKSIKISPSVDRLKFIKETSRKYKISGNFKYGQSYTLESLAKPVDSGRAFMEQNKFSFSGPGISNRISSQSNGDVVELKSRQLFPVMLSGVTSLKAELTYIPAVMIPDVDRLNSSGTGLDEDGWKWVKNTYQVLNSNGLVKKQFLHEISFSSDAFFSPETKDKARPFSLPLTFRDKPDQGGAWLMRLSDPDNSQVASFSQLVQVTDMSISYKLSEGSLVIWVTSINEGIPIADAEVLVRGKGQSTFYVGKTDENGLLTLTGNQKALDVSDEDQKRLGQNVEINLSELTWVIAATDKDSSAVKLDNCIIKPFVWNQQNDVSQGSHDQTGYLFTERGIYRPGETVHFKFVSRIYSDDQIKSPENGKVKIEIISPRGDPLYSRELSLNSFGSCFDDFKSESFMPIGTYTINAIPVRESGKNRKFSQTFLMQQFKEPRHQVALSVRTEESSSSEYISLKMDEKALLIDANSRYYAGGPVRNGRVKWKVDLVPANNKVQGYEGFFFGNSTSESRFLESGEANLDAQGHIMIRVPLDAKLLTGVYGVKVSVTALDIDGEPATDVVTYNPRPKFLIGLSEHPTQVQPGYTGAQKFVVLGPDGNAVSDAPVQITWLQKRYLYVQKRDDQGNMVDSWEEGWIRNFSSSQTTRNGEGAFDVELNQPGDYMVNVSYEKDNVRYATQTTYSVGWEDYERWMRNQGPGLSKSFGDLVLSLNKKEFETGELLQASANTLKPVRKVLATIERDKAIEAKVVDVEGKNIKFDFPIVDKYRPNVFVGALAPSGRQVFPVYYNQADTDIPSIYSGYANATVRTSVKKIKVEIAPGVNELKAKPGSETSIKLLTRDAYGKAAKCEVAVCVVNEAVLALTGFKTPDLATLTDFNLALSVLTGDLRVRLISQDLQKILGTRPVTGGGVGAGLVTPSLRKDFRPVAFFSPSLQTNEEGEVTINFTLPETTTAYRVYAVAADQTSGFSSAQKNLVVSKEFFLEPSVPRFLCYGDKASFPLVINNSTDHEGSAQIEAKGSSKLELKLKNTFLKIPARSNSSEMVFAEVNSSSNEAEMSFSGRLETTAGTFEDNILKTIPISSKYSPINVSHSGAFTSRTDIKVSFPDYVKAMSPGEVSERTLNASLDLSLTDWARISPTLNYLMTYPFGCVEQTSSGVIPLVAMKSLIANGVIPGIQGGDLDKFIKSGLERILSMQLSSGAFSYWPRQNYASFWGTVYGTYALETARQWGYNVPNQSVQKALKYLKESIFTTQRKPDEIEQPWIMGWAFLTLAEGNFLSVQDFEPLFKKYASADDETKALLLLTAKKINYLPNKKLESEIRSIKVSDQSMHSGTMDSMWRKQAALLMASLAIEGGSQLADNLAGKLLKGLKPDGRWNSTVDSGWCLLALSKYYQTKPKKQFSPTEITINYGTGESKAVKIGDVGSHLVLPALSLLKNDSISLKSSTGHLVNYTLKLSYPGRDEKNTNQESVIELNKKIENMNGSSEIRLGDVVKVTLEMDLSKRKNPTQTTVFEYVALEDFVPAGLYPINTRIATEGMDSESEEPFPDDQDSYYSSLLIPSHVEFHDEGVRVFKNRLYGGVYRFSYLARAVTVGEFWMRGSRLSLMYDPSKFGHTVGKKIVIAPQK